MNHRIRTVIQAASLVFAWSCGGGECLIHPCLPPIALTLSVTVAGTGAMLANAFVQPSGNSQIPCNQAPGNNCQIWGAKGTYEIDIGAPGFQTIHRSITVTGTDPDCGCSTADTQHLDVALTPAS